MVGYGASCDADHITAGLSDGSGALLAILGAMKNVTMLPPFQDELWLVNAHATSTPRGDNAELQAIKSFLSLLKSDFQHWDLQVPENGPYVTANKSNLGHMISASGSAEAALTCLSLHSGIVPGIINLEQIDGEGKSDIKLMQGSVKDDKSTYQRRLALKNSFGFGGTNSTIILAEYKAS